MANETLPGGILLEEHGQSIGSRTVFITIMALAIASFLPDFRASVMPCHDALQCQCAFQYYYSSLVHENDLPLWLPYGQYGIVSVILMMYVTPTGYLVGIAGKLLAIANTMLLFKFVVLFEFLIFCAGTFKLSSILFKRNETVLFAGIGAVFSFNWVISLDSNFHTYYMLPFILRHMILFMNTGRMRQLWIAGIFSVVSCVGNVPYYPPLLALLLTLFVAVMFKRPVMKPVFEWSDLVPFVIFMIFASAFLGNYVLNYSGLASFTYGRDPISKAVEKDVFLTYGGVTKVDKLAVAFLTPQYLSGDTTFYIGLAPLFLFVYALIKCNRAEFLAISVMGIFLVLFSFGGIVAFVAYHFPGMKYYRHVGVVFGQAKFLILLGGAFGLDHMLQSPAPGPRPVRVKKLLTIIGLIVLTETVVSFFNAAFAWHFVLWPRTQTFAEAALSVGFRIVFYFIFLLVLPRIFGAEHRTRKRFLSTVGLLLLAYLFDVGLFRIAGCVRWPLAGAQEIAENSDLFQPRKLPYQRLRIDPELIASATPVLLSLKNKPVPSNMYSHIYNLIGLDPSIPMYRTDLLSECVAQLFRMREVKFRQYPSIGILSGPNPALPKLLDELGCTQPKLRLTGEGEAPGSAVVTAFGPNYLKARVNRAAGNSAKLYYADSFHPGWRAYVNGREVPIEKANIAFKSIPVPSGISEIEFRFFNGWGSICLYTLAIGSAVFMGYIVIRYPWRENLR